MTRRATVGSLLLAGAVMAAGCGSRASQSAAPTAPAGPPSLATSLVTASGTWAVAVMGGSAASHNNFWQLFVRPAGTASWRLATPPGVASNGGLVLAGLSAGSVLAGFRPSQDLSYSPLATTRDNGAIWSPGLLDAALADVPGALAASQSSGRLLALLADGTTDLSAPGGTAWRTLATHRALAASTAGTRCGLVSLTAVAFSRSGDPLAAGSCARRGTAGIFSYANGSWHNAGPALPAVYAHQAITVLALSTTGGATVALLEAGAGSAARLLAVWPGGGGHWVLSRALRLDRATPTSASPGSDGSVAVILSDGHAVAITRPGGSWRPLPVLPPGAATLTPGPSGGWTALAVHRAQLTVWQAAPGSRAWASTQVIKVPIPYGSSG
ncbi:MAG: hypothetical protein ACLPKI_04925 [Streptosporangiaceae bacterium]